MHKLTYLQGHSLPNRLYPLSKLVWLIIGTILVFILTDGVLLTILAVINLVALVVLHAGIWRVRGFRFTTLTGVALLLLYLLFNKTGAVLLDPGPAFLMVTSGGLSLGLRVSGRFLTIVYLSYLFILSTEPSDLAYSLMRLGLPYRFGFMLVTALRLSPILEEESRTIYQAQLVRGVRYDRGGMRRLVLLTRQFMTPVLISALQRADKLVFSMEGRGFGQFTHRTFRQRTEPSKLDLYFNLVMILGTGLLLFVNHGGI